MLAQKQIKNSNFSDLSALTASNLNSPEVAYIVSENSFYTKISGVNTQIEPPSIYEYNCGGGTIVVATGLGVTFVRTTASVWTFTIPAGVKLLTHRTYSTSAENPGANVTIIYNYASNTVTNQGFTTACPPTYATWNMQTGVNTQGVTGGSAAAAFRPSINAVSGGNITMLNTMGSAIGANECLIVGTF